MTYLLNSYKKCLKIKQKIMSNRYTNITPSQFSPLSLQEQMMVPLAKQKQHDNNLQSIAQNSIFNVDTLDLHNDILNPKIEGFKSRLDVLRDEMMSKGNSRDITKKLINLKAERDDFLSANGDGGKAQLVKKQYLENIKSLKNNRYIKPEDAGVYTNKAYSNYKDLQNESNGVIDYTDYSGMSTRDPNEEAMGIATKMVVDNDTLYTKNGTLVNKKKLTPDEIYKRVTDEMNNDSKLMNYLNETGRNAKTTIHNAAVNASNSKKVNEQHVRGSKSDDSKSNEKETPTGLSFTQDSTKVAATKFIPDSFQSTKIEEFVSQNENFKEQLSNPYLSNEDKLNIQRKQYAANTTMRLANKKVVADMNLSNDPKWNEGVIYDFENNYRDEMFTNQKPGDKTPLTNEEITSAFLEGNYAGSDSFFKTQKNSNGSYNIIETKGWGTGDDVYRGTISGEFKKTKMDVYNNRLQDVLKNNALIPYKSLTFQNDNTTDNNRRLSAIEDSFAKSLKQNKIDVNKLDEEDRELFKDFSSNGSYKNVSFLGFTISSSTGEIYANLELPKSSKLNDNNDNILSYPLNKLNEQGSIPKTIEKIFDDIETNGTPETRKAVRTMRSQVKMRNIIPYSEKNNSNSGKFDQTQIQEYKNHFRNENIGNNGQYKTSLMNTINSSKKVRILTDTSLPSIDFKEDRKLKKSAYKLENPTIPSGFVALSYVNDKNEEKTLTIGDMIKNYSEQGFNSEQLLGSMNNLISTGKLHLLQGFDKDEILNAPYIITEENKGDLLNFKATQK